jgi:hypothetical protein
MPAYTSYIKAIADGVDGNDVIYLRPDQTGQITSYYHMDDGYRVLNDIDSYIPPSSGIVSRLETRKRWKLLQNNEFGHKFRFTGINGAYLDPETFIFYNADGTVISTGGIYANFNIAFPDYYVIDWHTGLGWYTLANNTNIIWTQALDECESLTVVGFDDWFIPSIYELVSISNLEYIYPLGAGNPPPANWPFHNTSQGNKWSSTTNKPYNDRAFFVTNLGAASFTTKTTIMRYIPCRYHVI